MKQSAFDSTWHHAMRDQGARLVRRYVKLQPSVQQKVDTEWDALFGGHRGEVLGIHIRGTDVLDTNPYYSYRRRIGTASYAPFVEAYLARYPLARIFLATDDQK